jgi:hypothetical protein
MTAHPKVDVPRVISGTQWLSGLTETLNGARHRRYIMLFMVVVLAHWLEHIVQAGQIWLLGWSRPDARGALGEAFPGLITSEALHYGYAVIMLVGIVLLRRGFTGSARTWWNAALAIQVWHHFEHLLLLIQAQTHHTFFGAAKPTSIIQLIAPRVELHLFYNAVVFAPMVAAIYLQYFARPAQGRGAARVSDP